MSDDEILERIKKVIENQLGIGPGNDTCMWFGDFCFPLLLTTSASTCLQRTSIVSWPSKG